MPDRDVDFLAVGCLDFEGSSRGTGQLEDPVLEGC